MLLLENHPSLTSKFDLFKHLVDFFEQIKLMEAIAFELSFSNNYDNTNSSKMFKLYQIEKPN